MGPLSIASSHHTTAHTWLCRFTPELLGVTASSMCGWLVVEILCYYAAFYLLNLNSSAGAWELCALTAYKYVG